MLELDSFLKSSAFLSIPYIIALVEKGILLGFNLDCILDTLARLVGPYFKTHNSATIGDLVNLDYKKLIDYERYLELLVTLSQRTHNNTNHSNEKLPPETTQNSNTDEDDEFNGGSQFFYQRGGMMTNMTRPKDQAAVCYQEYMAYSMSLINDKSNLRPIVVDGNDVALSASATKQVFALERIKLVVDYFEVRGHVIYVILPLWRKEQLMANGNNGVNNSNSSNSNNTNVSVVLTSSGYMN